MTPEEIANGIVHDMGQEGAPWSALWAIKIKKAITAAIEEERAACAFIADCVASQMNTESDGVDNEEENAERNITALIIRDRIRARGKA